jgi:hypothetical protein
MITVILRINHLVAWRMYAIENAPHVAKMSTSRASKPTHAPSEPIMSPLCWHHKACGNVGIRLGANELAHCGRLLRLGP